MRAILADAAASRMNLRWVTVEESSLAILLSNDIEGLAVENQHSTKPLVHLRQPIQGAEIGIYLLVDATPRSVPRYGSEVSAQPLPRLAIANEKCRGAVYRCAVTG